MENRQTAEKQLELITSMINQAKRNISEGDSFQLLLWGWVVAAANFGHYALSKIEYEIPYIVWLLVIPAAVISIVQGKRKHKNAKFRGYLDAVYGHIWLAISVGIVIILFFMYKLEFNHNPVILIFAGIGTYMTGILLKFRPVILGAVALWIGSVLAFLAPIDEQYLIGGIAIIIGYLIPGYYLKRAQREKL